MKTFDFLNSVIGETVYITGDRDLGMRGELRQLIFNKTPMRLIKLTKSGNAYLYNEISNKFYSVPPSNVREYLELIDKNVITFFYNERAKCNITNDDYEINLDSPALKYGDYYNIESKVPELTKETFTTTYYIDVMLYLYINR